MKHESIVIAGAGHAGVVAAFRLRALGFQGSVTVVGDEPELPYHRPPLSKTALSQADGVQPQPLRQAALYEREQIRLLSGCRVQAIHRSARVVELSDSRELDYDVLILATGSRPRTLTQAEAADNVHTLRTLADARRIRAAVEDSQHLLVVGGGYIGLEVAASARQMGIHVTLVEQHSRILGRVASAQTAARFRTLHQDEGVVLKEGVGIAALTAESGRITHAVLTDGTELPVDNIIAGIGVLPNVEVAQAAGLEADNGIRVDATCRTSDPVIYAIGDCASFLYRGMPVRLESVQNATDMADAAARAIIGEPVSYEPIPWFWSDQYATKLQMAGLTTGDERTIERVHDTSRVSFWHVDFEDRLVAVEAINDPQAFMMAKRWLAAAYQPSLTHLADPSVALKDIPPAEQATCIAG